MIGSVDLAQSPAESDGQLKLDTSGAEPPTEKRQQDLLGQVYEYFLGQFALAEGKKGGQFYTPESVVRVLVEMLEPYSGRVFDPCCGSGGMFVQSEKFISHHQGRLDDISIYGQESNEWKPSPPAPLPESEGSRSSEVPRPAGEGFRERAAYQDIKGFCKSATLAEIEKHNFVLTPGRYVGIPDEEEDEIPFEEKMGALTAELAAQMREAQVLDEEIKIQLAKVGFDLEIEP